jgi:hypothetical protein
MRSQFPTPIALAAAVFALGLLAACDSATEPDEQMNAETPNFNIRLEIGEDSGGPPYYSLVQDGWFPMTEEWAAVFWMRDPSCVPGDFNLLSLADLTPAFPSGPPRPFLCSLTIGGHEIWNTDPPDPAVGPLNITAYGLGAVPIYFVDVDEAQAALGDGVLTIDELEGMSSLQVGYADQFHLTQQTGTARGEPGAGKINISSTGTLQDGRTFFFQTAEGSPNKDPIAQTRIEIR